MHKQHLIIFILVVACVCLYACKGDMGSSSIPEGFVKESSGGIGYDTVNIKSVNEIENGIDIVFAKNSDITGSGEVEVSTLPKYSLCVTDSPNALVLQVENCTYTDFEHADSQAGSLADRLFFDERACALYIELGYDVAFKVSENSNVLSIELVSVGVKHSEDDFAYYVTSNTFDYYVSGLVEISGMRPCRSRDGRAVFISQAYSKAKDARTALVEYKSKYPEYAASFELIAMYYGELPIYNDALDGSAALLEEIIRKENAIETPECLLTNGFFLAETEEGMVFDKLVAYNDTTGCELYIHTDAGDRRLVNFQFANIEQVKYSADEKKLAVLENSTTGSHLYVFAADTGELLYDLSDVGFGKRISGFVWNETGTAIYAVSGTDSIAVNMYDFSVADETKRTVTIYTKSVDEGSFDLYEGRLYFTSTDENDAAIYSFKPEIGVAETLCSGSAFAFCNDYIAITTVSSVASMESGEYSFFIMNMATGEKHVVTEAFGVFDFEWSSDGKYLYYVENTLNGSDVEQSSGETTDDPFPYRLYRYSIDEDASVLLCDISQYSRLDTVENSPVIMYFNDDESGASVRASYIIR